MKSREGHDFVQIPSGSYGLRPLLVCLSGPFGSFPITVPDLSKMSGSLHSLETGTFFISSLVIHSLVLSSPGLGSSFSSQQKLSFYYRKKNNILVNSYAHPSTNHCRKPQVFQIQSLLIKYTWFKQEDGTYAWKLLAKI